MSNIKTKNNTYITMKTYNNSPKCRIDLHMKETFFSLYASIRRPFSPSYYDPTYVEPLFPGVN